MRVFHARVKNADACVSDTQTRITRVFWAQYLRPVLYVLSIKMVKGKLISLNTRGISNFRKRQMMFSWKVSNVMITIVFL